MQDFASHVISPSKSAFHLAQTSRCLKCSGTWFPGRLVPGNIKEACSNLPPFNRQGCMGVVFGTKSYATSSVVRIVSFLEGPIFLEHVECFQFFDDVLATGQEHLQLNGVLHLFVLRECHLQAWSEIVEAFRVVSTQVKQVFIELNDSGVITRRHDSCLSLALANFHSQPSDVPHRKNWHRF